MKIKKYIGEIYTVVTSKDFFSFPSSLSYYFVLSIIPLLFLLEFLLMLFNIPNSLIKPIIDMIPGIDEGSISTFFAARQAVDIVAFIIAFALSFNVLAGAVKAIIKISDKLFLEYVGKSRLKGWPLTLKSYKITALLLFFIIGASLVLILIENAVNRFISIHFFTPAMIFIGLLIIILLFYRVIPNHRIHFRHLFPGALTAAVANTLVIIIFRFLTSTIVDFNNIYGPLSYVVSLLILCYFIATSLFVGLIVVVLNFCKCENGKRNKRSVFKRR